MALGNLTWFWVTVNPQVSTIHRIQIFWFTHVLFEFAMKSQTFEQGRNVIWFFSSERKNDNWLVICLGDARCSYPPVLKWRREMMLRGLFVNLKKQNTPPPNFLVLFRIFKTWEYRTSSSYQDKQEFRRCFFLRRETARESWNHSVLQRERTPGYGNFWVLQGHENYL